ncbi:MAG: hypothetical protein ACJ8CH_17670 [Microvirga sp.]
MGAAATARPGAGQAAAAAAAATPALRPGAGAASGVQPAFHASRPGGEIVERRITAARTLRDEDVVQHLRDLRRVAEFHPVDAQRRARRVGAVEALHPLGGALQELRVLRHRHHGVHARDRLEANHPLALPALVRFENPLELVDHRLRRGRL